MELYEALKSGTSAEDLEAAFSKELIAAQNRISEEEKEKAKKTYLNNCRSDLAKAIYDYANALLKNTDGNSEENKIADTSHIEDIEDKLFSFEQEMFNLYHKTKELKDILDIDKFFNKVPTDSDGVEASNDNDIISEFLKSL